MPSTSTTILVTLVLFLATAGGYIYLFGLPPWLKRELEEKALETMGMHLSPPPSTPHATPSNIHQAKTKPPSWCSRAWARSRTRTSR